MLQRKKAIIAQVGLGRWGKNLLRNFSSLPDCFVKYGCDSQETTLQKYVKDYPQVSFTTKLSAVLNDQEVSAVVVSTSAPTHFEVAEQCLKKGKHVFVEKPITLSVADGEKLLKIAKEHNRKIMVGHLLLYHPAVKKLKELIEAGEMGKIYYVYTQRLNLGTIRNTENVVWSLAPHDISIVLYLIGGQISSVSALGASFVQKEIEDVAFLNLRFKAGEIGHVHVSWLDPTKTRRTMVVGSKKMAIFDEMASRDTLLLIDRGVDLNPEYQTFEDFLKLRFGEGVPIALSNEEPLQLECQHFIDCVANNVEPLSNGQNGLDILTILSAAERSLKNGGKNELF